MPVQPTPHTQPPAQADAPRLRVLVLAESCNPEWASIPLVGWSHYEAVSHLADTHLVTRVRNRPAIDRYGLKEGRDYTAIDTEFFFDLMYRLVRRISGPNKGWAMLTALTIPSYLLFEYITWWRFRAQLKKGRFDLVHRITPLSPAVPSPMAAWCRKAGVPFVVGPLNGGLPWPAEFPNLRAQEKEWLSRFRGLFRALPGYRATRNAASALIMGGISAFKEVPARWKDKTFYVPENGYDPARFVPPTPRTYTGRPLRAIFLGRLVVAKGCDMLLEAAAPLLRAGTLELTIIGGGPEDENLRTLARTLDIENIIRFTGDIAHRDVAQHVAQADIMTFPSVHEFGGAVVLEAMCMGVVPIVADYGGPAELASRNCGFLIPLQTREPFITAIRTTLEGIIANPQQLEAMSANALRRASTLFAWPRKAEQTLAIYHWVLNPTRPKPDWGMPLRDPAPESLKQ